LRVPEHRPLYVRLRSIDAASVFLVALDDERTSFRYHHLVRQVLRAELRARDRACEQALQLRAAEWFEATGDSRRASRHFLAAREADRALALIQDRVVTEFLRDPALPPPLDLSMVDPALLAGAPDRLLALAADLLLSGDTARGGDYVDLLERAQPPIEPESQLAARVAVLRSVRLGQTGQIDEAVDAALAARTAAHRWPRVCWCTRCTSITSMPRISRLASSPCSAAQSASSPYSTVLTGSTEAVRHSKSSNASGGRTPETRIS
jgi:LuxR family maltose regulon positive regulatory protein